MTVVVVQTAVVAVVIMTSEQNVFPKLILFIWKNIFWNLIILCRCLVDVLFPVWHYFFNGIDCVLRAEITSFSFPTLNTTCVVNHSYCSLTRYATHVCSLRKWWRSSEYALKERNELWLFMLNYVSFKWTWTVSPYCGGAMRQSQVEAACPKP